jgi:broad specificity phosphatase PhoE
MKWPSSLTVARHAESQYNVLKEKKKGIPEWSTFTRMFNSGYNAKNFEHLVVQGVWPNPELVALAREMHKKIADVFGNFNDFNTPLTETGWEQARTTGKNLRENGHQIPDIVYVSPYLRTLQTHEGMTQEWPELKDVRKVEDERLREQEHGLQILYYDWRIFSVFHPEEAALQKKIGEYAYRFPGGESVCNVRERTRDFVSMLIREHQDEHVMAITHHLTILSTRANLERWGQDKFMKTDEKEKPANCGITIYRGDATQGKGGRLVLEEYNKVHY